MAFEERVLKTSCQTLFFSAILNSRTSYRCTLVPSLPFPVARSPFPVPRSPLPVLVTSARKLVSLGEFFVYVQYRNKSLRLASETFGSAGESKLSLVTGLVS